jgi:hypothetical protein
MKTAFVFLLSLTITIVLPNPIWAHGGGGGGGGGGAGGGGGGGAGGSSSAGGGGGGGGGSSSAGGGGGSSSAGGGKGGEMGHGGSEGVGVTHGRSNGGAPGRGFGFGHAGVLNPGHKALSGRSSHSQKTSHKGGTPDDRSFSNHIHAEQSLAQDHLAKFTKVDQAMQVHDKDPGKTKGFVDSLPPDQELQADRSVTLNPETIHSDLDDVVALGLHPNQEPNLDRGRTLNLEMIHLDLENFATLGENITTLGLQSGQELQADGGRTLSRATIHSEVDDTVKRGLPPVLARNLAHVDSVFLEEDDTPATTFPDREALDDIRVKMLPPTSPVLDDDDATGWKLVPFYGLLLVFLIAIVFSRQGILRMFQWKTFRQPPNP